jgi:hypothetical protein
MLTADQLRESCYAIRKREAGCDEELVAAIEADIQEYRLARTQQLPPDYLVDRLPLMGWLMYEATWNALLLIPDRRAQRQAVAEANHKLIARVANAARNMPWPEYAIRSLGAFRSLALAESKEDTEEGYVRAQMAHLEARGRHATALTYHRDADAKGEHHRALDEMLVQLALAETGTACRTAERMVGLWDVQTKGKSETETQQLGEERTQDLFDQLSGGIDIGELALEAADRVNRHHGFVNEVSEEGLALPTSFINPGIMTARAVLLTLALYPEMARLGRFPLSDDDTWDQTRQRLGELFDKTYEYIERPIVDSHGNLSELRDDFKVQIVQIRLNAALLMPGHRLPSEHDFAPCLAHEVLDDSAIEAMCAWLTEPIEDQDGRQRQRGVHRGIGSATMPAVIDGIEACRVAFGGRPGYRNWRARWFVLDSHINEPGRAERVETLLGRPITRTRPI